MLHPYSLFPDKLTKRTISVATIFSLVALGLIAAPNAAVASTATTSVVTIVDQTLEEGVLPTVTLTITATTGTTDPTGTVAWTYCYGPSAYPDCNPGVDLALAGHGEELVDVGTPGDGTSFSTLTNFTPPFPTGYYIFLGTYSGDDTYGSSIQSLGLEIAPAASPFELNFNCTDSAFYQTFTRGEFGAAVGGPVDSYAWRGGKYETLNINASQVVRVNFINCEQGLVDGAGYQFNEGGGGFGGVTLLSNPKTVSIILDFGDFVTITGVVQSRGSGLTPDTFLILNLENIASGGGGGGDGGGGGEPEEQANPLQQINYFVAQGFSKGKSVLTDDMKVFIDNQVDRATTAKKFVCIGTVRGKKWTQKRTALALSRAEAGCDYIEESFPNATFELRKRLIKKLKQDSLTVRVRVFS